MDIGPLIALGISLLQLCSLFVDNTRGSVGAVQITAQNFEAYRSTKDIVLLNFYADWCRFSQQLKPIFERAATALHGNRPEQVLLGKVNCEVEKGLCSTPFHVNKYPTLKLVRHGQIARREYRGQRSVDAIVSFVENQLKNPIQPIESYYELGQKELKKSVVGFFANNESMEYDFYRKAAINFRDDCPFFAIFGQQNEPQIAFKEEGSPDITYTGPMNDFFSMMNWVQDRCVPLVREITFANGEEMTEEGLPLLILFYHPEEPEIKELFRQRVEAELAEHKGMINCVTADGTVFAHPLHHLGKTKHDLPVLAIDSFRHMFLFPKFEDIRVPGKLKQFVDDLHSGKLHREFHHGPDPTEKQPETAAKIETGEREKRADPPESTFKNLQPPRSRYTLLRDEL